MTQHVRAGYRRHRKGTWGLTLLLGVTVGAAAVLLGAVGSGSAASSNKTLNGTTIDPNPVAATGSSVTFTLHLRDDATSPNQLGSAQIVAPTIFTNVSITGYPAGASLNSTTNVLTNLAIAPGQTKNVTIQATTPTLCADPGNLYWLIYAKQSNDFNGNPGNNFSPYPFQLRQQVSGSCTLTFVNQPAETAGTTGVRTSKWGAILGSGNSIQVKVTNGGSDVASPSGTVNITATGTGCPATSGASNVGFSSGVATFSNLTVGNVASAANCTLHATSSFGYAAADSSSFKVDPSSLYFVTQPASAVVNTVLTDQVNGGTVSPPAGNPIQVGVQTTDGTNFQQLNGTGSVSMAISGAGCTLAASGTSASFSGGVASFSTLTPTSVANGCTLNATTTSGYNSATSTPFNVAQSGCYGSPCTITTQGQNGSQLITTAAGGFVFVIVNSAPSIPDTNGGCANFIGTGTGFDETDGRNADGTLDFTLYITNNALKNAYGPNYGQPDVPICSGAKRLDSDQQPVDCGTDLANGLQGFADRVLGTDGKFNGHYSTAQCGAGGYWWGILGTKQDPSSLGFDSSQIPLITGWGTDGPSRTFNIHVPPGWDIGFKG
jgi:hypothetical protein